MKGTVLRNKIVFLLIFVFSFIIVHDTVLDVIQSDHDSFVAQSSDTNVDNNMYHPLPHLHSMFHFVALIEDTVSFIVPLRAEVKITSLFLPILYTDNAQLVRPPIA